MVSEVGEIMSKVRSAVSLSSDGETIAIGARHNDRGGQTRIYKWSQVNASWVQMGSDIDGAAKFDRSGSSVSLSSDGKNIAIGSPGSYPGHTRIYKWSPENTSWVQMGSNIDGEAADGVHLKGVIGDGLRSRRNNV